MGESTKIEWADHTINLWWGCTEVSPACTNCYARTIAARFGQPWGRGAPRTRKKGAAALARTLNRKAQKSGERVLVFGDSMFDWLDPEVPAEWLADLLALVAETPALTWLLLTKRPHLFGVRIEAAQSACAVVEDLVNEWLVGRPPANVWVGTTVEDQERADERVPALLKIPARVRFLSCEPLLGPVDLGQWLCDECDGSGTYTIDGEPRACVCVGTPGIDWIIAGGESGRGARPTHPDWFRSLRDQAQAAGVAFFMKQWGEHVEVTGRPEEDDGTVEAGDGTFAHMRRVGKKAAGRELDGRTWDEVPRGR